MVHPTWRTTSSKLGPLSNALMILLFTDFLPINNKTQIVESTRMQLGMLFEPPNWPNGVYTVNQYLTLNEYLKFVPQTQNYAT